MTRTTLDAAAATWEAIDSLTPWAQNPRNNDDAVEQVAESIRRFGFASPIIARAADRSVIAGHTRLKAAQQLGLDLVPVRFVDLDEDEARALALADNKLNEIATWDEAGLAEVMRELEQTGLDLAGLGWQSDELDALLSEMESTPEAPATAPTDALPEAPPALTSPGEVISLGRHTLTCGDCVEMMRALPEGSVDAIVTDPPYGIGFMGKGWDAAVPGDTFAAEALRVLKPGGHIIAFAATRTIHRLTVALEDAGFEIRDQIGWLQYQGFPKSLDVSKAIDGAAGVERRRGPEKVAPDGKPASQRLARGPRGEGAQAGDKYGVYQNDPEATCYTTLPATPEARRWSGWGTALKPAIEPAILARKPLVGTVAENVLAHGTGALNIDACRYGEGDAAWPGPSAGDGGWGGAVGEANSAAQGPSGIGAARPVVGRWPANVYACPKPAQSERNAGTDSLPQHRKAQLQGAASSNVNDPVSARLESAPMGNHHPTVKPIELMRWLARLVTPPGGTLLEPFCGSGTTLLAAEAEGFTCIASEMTPEYCDIIRARYNAHRGES